VFEEEFRQVPAEPPRRVESLPGLRLRGTIPKWVIVFPLFFLVFFLTIPLSIMNSDPAMRLSTGATETVEGRVVSVGSASACRGSASRRVVYAFSAKSGKEYRGAQLVCEEASDFSLEEGDPIKVRYLRSDPAIHDLPNEARNEPPPLVFFLFMPIFFLAVLGALFWPPIGAVFKARRLFKSGQIATGKVIFVKKRANIGWPGMQSNVASSVYIQMQSPAGGLREVVAPCHNDWLLSQLTPGTSVHVAYKGEVAKEVALLDAYIR
jgi:Protein of unknown function (DUF3592)